MRTYKLISLCIATLALPLCATNRYDELSSAYLTHFPTTPLTLDTPTNEFLDTPQLSSQELRRLACTLLRTHEEALQLFDATISTPETWRNLNLYASNDRDFTHTVTGALNRTTTITGEVTLAALLTEQTSDVAVLRARQECLRQLIADDELHSQIKQHLAAFARAEPLLLNLSQPHDPLYDRAISFAHYDFPVEDETSWLYKNQYLQEIFKWCG